MGTGEAAYSTEGMQFGPTGPALEAAGHSAEGRASPSGQDHSTSDREYKFSTDETRHSPCEESSIPPRSPAQ